MHQKIQVGMSKFYQRFWKIIRVCKNIRTYPYSLPPPPPYSLPPPLPTPYLLPLPTPYLLPSLLPTSFPSLLPTSSPPYSLPPPFFWQKYGNLQMFPRPTQNPRTVKKNWTGLSHVILLTDNNKMIQKKYFLKMGIFWKKYIILKELKLSIKNI